MPDTGRAALAARHHNLCDRQRRRGAAEAHARRRNSQPWLRHSSEIGCGSALEVLDPVPQVAHELGREVLTHKGA